MVKENANDHYGGIIYLLTVQLCTVVSAWRKLLIRHVLSVWRIYRHQLMALMF